MGMRNGEVKTYSELCHYTTFEERFDYLSLSGQVGESTFGHERWINQDFYISHEWKDVRRHVILRDRGCDLGIPGREIYTDLLVHHINPMTSDDIIHGELWILDPEYLITTTKDTHNAIHYGNRTSLRTPFVERSPGDTTLWGKS